MKRLLPLLTLVLLLGASQLAAQEIAPNFTKTDIDGNSATLYAELDKGNAVLLDFFHSGCHACQHFVPQVEQLQADYEGRLLVWKMDVYNESEASIRNFKSTYGSTVRAFNDCGDDFWYYVGKISNLSPAATPTFVLVFPDRSIQFTSRGFSNSGVRNALENLPTSVDENMLQPASFRLFPNPVNELSQVQFSLERDADLEVQVFDASGALVADLFAGRVAAHSLQSVQLPAGEWANGVYYLRMRSAAASFTRAFTIAR